jgi:hypothetical protein
MHGLGQRGLPRIRDRGGRPPWGRTPLRDHADRSLRFNGLKRVFIRGGKAPPHVAVDW